MSALARHQAIKHAPRPAASTLGYFALFVRHPARTWAQLLADPARLRYGLFAVLTVALGYAVTVAGIAWSGGTPSPPWLPIPVGDYFKWEALFVAPVTLLCWVLASGVAYLLSKRLGGRGTFDDTLALLGFAIALPTLITLIPDALRALLTSVGALNRAVWEDAVNRPGTGDFLFLWACMLGYLLALLCLFPMAVACSQRLPRGAALVVGIAGAIVYQGVYFIFIR